jgi:hypothetical protein
MVGVAQLERLPDRLAQAGHRRVAGPVERRQRLPGIERLSLNLYGHYAPGALSFGDIDDYRELGLDLSYEVIKSASIYVGYREIVADVDPAGEIEAADGLHAGLRLTF